MSVAFYALADLTFVIFPIIIISKLHMTLSRRLGLIGIMALSLFTCAMSIMKGVSAIDQQTGPDATYTGTLSLLWATLEQACVVLLGNIAPLRALMKLDMPLLNTFINSMASILGRSSRSNTKSSTLGKNVRCRNDAYYDIEMNTDVLGNRSTAVWREVKANSSYNDNLRQPGHVSHVRRTDAFTVEYDEPNVSPD